jgi:hypothetical protein
MPPLDPSTRIQTPTGTGEEMLLQGFNWESSRIEGGGAWYRKMTEMAPQMAEMGITVAWLPPPTDSVSQEGYMPRDLYNLNCKYGTKEELKTCIEALHKHGIKCLGDAVLNHRCAQFQGPDGLWNQYGGKLDWDARAIVSDDPHFGGQGTRAKATSSTPRPTSTTPRISSRRTSRSGCSGCRARLDTTGGVWTTSAVSAGLT